MNSAKNSESASAVASVTESAMKNAPVTPERSAIGAKTTIVVTVEPIIGTAISAMPSRTASKRSAPSWMRR